MGDKRTFPLALMRERAEEVLVHLRPYVKRAEIAGSIRREKPEVGDIEIIFEPIVERRETGLFGEQKDHNLQFEGARQWIEQGILRHRLSKTGAPCFGPSFQRVLWDDDIPLDLFGVVEPAQWGIVKLIRTGPADFSHRFVTSRLEGGWMPPGMRQCDGFQLFDGPSAKYIPVPEEEDYFHVIGRDWIEPRERR